MAIPFGASGATAQTSLSRNGFTIASISTRAGVQTSVSVPSVHCFLILQIYMHLSDIASGALHKLHLYADRTALSDNARQSMHTTVIGDIFEGVDAASEGFILGSDSRSRVNFEEFTEISAVFS
jgi:hypothetical protein